MGIKNNVILREDDSIINDPLNVSNILNEYFVNITRSIGCEDAIYEGKSFDDILNKHLSNDSIIYIYIYNKSQHKTGLFQMY